MKSRADDTVGHINLDHAIADLCSDPDCEIHNPEVGVEEGTVSLTDLAFFIAGYFAGAAAVLDQYDTVKHNFLDDLRNDGVIPRPQEGE